MSQVPPNVSVFVMHESVSFSNGIDGMAAIARTELAKEPMDGDVRVSQPAATHGARALSRRLRILAVYETPLERPTTRSRTR
jgi:hypothetical protein